MAQVTNHLQKWAVAEINRCKVVVISVAQSIVTSPPDGKQTKWGTVLMVDGEHKQLATTAHKLIIPHSSGNNHGSTLIENLVLQLSYNSVIN